MALEIIIRKLADAVAVTDNFWLMRAGEEGTLARCRPQGGAGDWNVRFASEDA